MDKTIDEGFIKLLSYLSEVRKNNKHKKVKNTALIVRNNEQRNTNL